MFGAGKIIIDANKKNRQAAEFILVVVPAKYVKYFWRKRRLRAEVGVSVQNFNFGRSRRLKLETTCLPAGRRGTATGI